MYKTFLSRSVLAVSFVLTTVGSCSSEFGSSPSNDITPDASISSSQKNQDASSASCGEINAVVKGVTPTVQLLIDQSGSMNASFGNTDRWRAVYSTLMGQNGVVNTLQNSVRFGLSLFTSLGGNRNGAECPIMTNVSANLNNLSLIDTVYAPATLGKDTPTGESIDAVVDILEKDTSPGTKSIVLGTDGEPDTCAEPDPQNGQAVSIAAAQRAYSKGIRVYVISVGNQVGKQHLQDMANAGAGLPIGGAQKADFFVANNPEDLVKAFDSIVSGVASCEFTINGEVEVEKAVEGNVTLDGETLKNITDWVMKDSKTFELVGQACKTIKDGKTHNVNAAFPCEVIQID